MLKTVLENYQLKALRREYRVGRVLTKFVTRDIRRDIEIIDVGSIEDGVISVRTKTWNALYVAKGLHEEPPFGEIKLLVIEHLWDWDGAQWGGEIPELIDKEV